MTYVFCIFALWKDYVLRSAKFLSLFCSNFNCYASLPCAHACTVTQITLFFLVFVDKYILQLFWRNRNVNQWIVFPIFSELHMQLLLLSALFSCMHCYTNNMDFHGFLVNPSCIIKGFLGG